MQLCLADLNDLESICEWIEQAKVYLKKQGIDQWQQGYPNHRSIAEDIEKQRGYMIVHENQAIGYLCLDFEKDPAYDHIRGQWLSEKNYAVIHRMTIGDEARGKGLGSQVFQSVIPICLEKNIHSIKIDTHEMNKKMQHLLAKNGFVYCGKINQADGERLAYEKII